MKRLLLALLVCLPSARLFGQDLEKLDKALQFRRNRNAQQYAITTPNGIDEGRFVTIGGVEQWITIRGEDRSNPVVLMLHGGPGDAINPWSYAVFRPWLKYFTVVQWDQRGSGHSYGRSGTAGLTAAQLTKDGVDLADWLRTTLHRKKIILVGHSWGSVLGLLMVKARPELFSVFVGSGQVGADAATATTVAYEQLLKKAAQAGDARAIRELREIGPPPWTGGNAWGVQHKWANFFEGANLFLGEMLGLALVAPGSSIKDINEWWDGELATGEVLGFTPVPRGKFQVPVIVIQGAEDFTTPTDLARVWLESIGAPRKELVTIDGAGHFAMFVKRDEFLRLMIARVLPLANAG